MTIAVYPVKTLILTDEKASQEWGRLLAAYITSPLILTLAGDLGTGKTTIIRALLQALGVRSTIKSPTFSLVESYSCNHKTIHHFDLYRVDRPEELDYVGFRDYFSDNSICCIEWPEQAGKALPYWDVRLQLTMHGMGRSLQMQAQTAAGEAVLQNVLGAL